MLLEKLAPSTMAVLPWLRELTSGVSAGLHNIAVHFAGRSNSYWGGVGRDGVGKGIIDSIVRISFRDVHFLSWLLEHGTFAVHA